MNNKEFVNKIKDIESNYKTVYALGMFGNPITNTIIEQKRKQYPSFYTTNKVNFLKSLVGKGYYGFDCVCLVKGVLWGFPNVKYASNNVPDINQEVMITKCKDVTTNFSNVQIGEFLWMKGHCGIYIGNGLAIECTPKWKNKVQITAVGNMGTKAGYNTRTWTKHGKLPYITYEEVVVKTDDKKERVKELQRTLNNQYKCGLEVDGLFGPLTTNACSKNYLYKGKKAPIHIKWLQTRLKQLGYNLGRYGVDGSMGQNTTNAVKKFQKDKKIEVDGYVGASTHKKLVD